jgi:ribosomal protein S6--L-glutamate ligase
MGSEMRLCFIVEDRYRHDGMPLAVARQLEEWGHAVDLLTPQTSVARVSTLITEGAYDAWVLKTVSEGPGLSLLEAAAAWGATTINDAQSIRRVRDKAVAAAVAGRRGLPFPLTYFAAAPELLGKVPDEHYPLVVKPVNGSAGRSVYLVHTPRELAETVSNMAGERFMLAQPYVTNPGVDLKVYNTGGDLYATRQPSPLHPDIDVPPRNVALPADLAQLVADIGAVFGLELYGVDVVEGPDGWVVVDVNDFPSFHCVPDAVARVATTILRLADHHDRGRPAALARAARVEGTGEGSNAADCLASAAALVAVPDDVMAAT